MDIVSALVANPFAIIGGIVSILAGAYAIALVIPGDQPDKTIKAVLDFTQKFSVKP